MRILNIDPNNPNPEIISQAVDCLRYGGVIVYPTDTCYGLGVDVTNPIAIERLYELKKRNRNKPVSVIVFSIRYIKEHLAILEPKQEEAIRNYLPGPITFILTSRSQNDFSHTKIGIRIPAYRLTQLISNKFQGPYATTSANISDWDMCYSINDYLYQLEKSGTNQRPDLILDGGILPKNLASTVVDLTENPPKIIRQGSVDFKI